MNEFEAFRLVWIVGFLLGLSLALIPYSGWTIISENHRPDVILSCFCLLLQLLGCFVCYLDPFLDEGIVTISEFTKDAVIFLLTGGVTVLGIQMHRSLDAWQLPVLIWYSISAFCWCFTIICGFLCLITYFRNSHENRSKYRYELKGRIRRMHSRIVVRDSPVEIVRDLNTLMSVVQSTNGRVSIRSLLYEVLLHYRPVLAEESTAALPTPCTFCETEILFAKDLFQVENGSAHCDCLRSRFYWQQRLNRAFRDLEIGFKAGWKVCN